MLALLLLAAATPYPPLPFQFAYFERSGALSHITETVSIETDRGESRVGRLEYKLRYVRRQYAKNDEVMWADSRTCPLIRPLLEAMQAVQMPRPSLPGIAHDPLMISVDGASYVLDAPSNFSMGSLTIRSNMGSPLSTWVDGALQKLATCWSGSELHVDPIAPR